MIKETKRKITFDNYFESTLGTWKFIKEYERDSVLSWSKRGGYKVITHWGLENLVAKATNIPVDELEHNYSSYNSFWKTGSFYVIHKKTNTIFRLSDHWSSSNNKKINLCLNIKSCWWELKVLKKDEKKVVGLKPRCKYYNYQLASIKLNKLENLTFNANKE